MRRFNKYRNISKVKMNDEKKFWFYNVSHLLKESNFIEMNFIYYWTIEY